MESKYVAQYDFQATNTDELDLKVGDFIVVTKQVDGGWWQGKVGERTGWFPENHVVPVDDPLRQSMQPPARNEEKRDSSLAFGSYVAKQLTDTERIYIETLQEIQDTIIAPLQNADWMTEYQKKTMISPLDFMIHMKKELWLDLQAQADVEQPENRQIGETLVRHLTGLFNAYLHYSASVPAAKAMLSDLSSYDNMRNFLQECKTRVTLVDAMELPLQRLKEYGSLLKELESRTPNSSRDVPALKAALTCIQRITSSCQAVSAVRLKQQQVLQAIASHPIAKALPPSGLRQLLLVRIKGRDSISGDHLAALYTTQLVILKPSDDSDPYSAGVTVCWLLPILGMEVDLVDDDHKSAVHINAALDNLPTNTPADMVLEVDLKSDAVAMVDTLKRYGNREIGLLLTSQNKSDSPSLMHIPALTTGVNMLSRKVRNMFQTSTHGEGKKGALNALKKSPRKGSGDKSPKRKIGKMRGMAMRTRSSLDMIESSSATEEEGHSHAFHVVSCYGKPARSTSISLLRPRMSQATDTLAEQQQHHALREEVAELRRIVAHMTDSSSTSNC